MRMYRLRLIVSRIRNTMRSLPEIAALARWSDHRLTPVARKPMPRRLIELMYIQLRWGEVSSAYYGQDCDRVGRSVNGFIAYPEFRRIRDSRNRAGPGKPFDYVCLLQDKALFAHYFGVGGLPVIPTVCELRPDGIELTTGERHDYAEMAPRLGPSRALFCKPRHGIHGNDAFGLEIRDGQLLVDGEATTPQALAQRIQAPYLCQDQIVQHEELARPHPESVNTLRLVTVHDRRTPEVLCASLKLGADRAVTDNGGATRYIVRLNPETGRCYEVGYRKGPGHAFVETTEHPQTGVSMADCHVPFYSECLDLVRRAHQWLPGVYSVGWDVALTPDGPRLLEGNDDWSGSTLLNYADLRQRFLELHQLRTATPEHPQSSETAVPQPRGTD